MIDENALVIENVNVNKNYFLNSTIAALCCHFYSELLSAALLHIPSIGMINAVFHALAE